MGTKDFNIIDKTIAFLRLNKITKYLNKNSVVLDFGCGSQAFFLNHIKNKIRKGIGLDYDVEPTKISPNIKLIKYKFVNKLPFPNNYFTEIYLLATLEHINTYQVDILFREFKRVLKKNGQIILTTPTPLSKPFLEFLAFRLHLISKKEIIDHKKYYNKEDIAEIAKNSDLILKKYDTFQFSLNSYTVLKK